MKNVAEKGSLNTAFEGSNSFVIKTKNFRSKIQKKCHYIEYSNNNFFN